MILGRLGGGQDWRLLFYLRSFVSGGCGVFGNKEEEFSPNRHLNHYVNGCRVGEAQERRDVGQRLGDTDVTGGRRGPSEESLTGIKDFEPRRMGRSVPNRFTREAGRRRELRAASHVPKRSFRVVPIPGVFGRRVTPLLSAMWRT